MLFGNEGQIEYGLSDGTMNDKSVSDSNCGLLDFNRNDLLNIQNF